MSSREYDDDYDDDRPRRGRGRLGRLSKSAHGESLKNARIAVIAAGVLIGIWWTIEFATLERQIDDQIKKERDKARAQRQFLIEGEVKKVKETAMRIGRLFCYGHFALAALLVFLGVILNKAPLPITVFALIAFVGIQILWTVISGDPRVLLGGLIWKVLIVIGLVKGIQSAAAMKNLPRRPADRDRYDDYDDDEDDYDRRR